MTTKNFGPGIFPTVAWHQGSWWVAWGRDESTTVYDGRTVVSIPRYSRPVLWSSGDKLWLALRSDRGKLHVRNLSTSQQVTLGPLAGGRSHLLGVGWVVWTAPGTGQGKRVLGRALNVLDTPAIVLRTTRASNGLGRIRGFHNSRPEVLDYDEHRKEVAGVFSPQFAGDWMVAEGKTAGTVVRHLPTSRERLLWPNWERYTPQCAVAPDGTLGVVSYGGGRGVELALVTVADLDEPEPPPAPPPVPHPPSPPEETPMPTMPNQFDVVERVRAQYPTPLGTQHLACLKAIAIAIGQSAGLLSKPDGYNIEGFAADIIAFPDGETWDVLSDAEGAARPQWVYAGQVETSRYRPVSSEPQPPPGPGGDLAARVTALEQTLARVVTALRGF